MLHNLRVAKLLDLDALLCLSASFYTESGLIIFPIYHI